MDTQTGVEYCERLHEWVREHALTYVERFNLSVVPVEGKQATVKWKPFQERRPTREELLGWQWPGVGIITGAISQLVVLDFDTLEAAEWFRRDVAQSPVVVQTRRGMHLYFQHPGYRVRNSVKVRGKYDIRGDGGLVVAPPTPGKDWQDGHALRHPRDLPVFAAEWLPDRQTAAALRTFAGKDISFPEAYIAKIRAVAGQSGHDETYKAVCYLRDAGVGKFEAAMIMARWNLTNAEPPWSDRELAHKLDEVFGG